MGFMPKGLFPLILLLLLFTISVYTTFGGDHAEPKLINTIRHGLTLFFAYSFLFSNTEKFDFAKLGVLYIVLAIFLVPMSIPVNGIEGPTDLFDFGFLRYQTHEEFIDVVEVDDDAFHIQYQNTGFLLLMGFGVFMIESKKNKLWQILLILAIVSLALLYTGSRQAIVSIFVMAFVWAFIINRDNTSTNLYRFIRNSTSANFYKLIGRWFAIILVVGVTYYIIGFLTEEEGLLESVVDEGYVEGAGRGDWLMAGVDQFLSHPVFGVGYGRFIVFNMYGSYPHNLFIELLCETGLVGFSIAMVLGVFAAIKNRKVFKPFLLLWLAYFLRSMASGEISLNIYVFVILFALSSAKYNEIQLINEGKHK
jgi:O-antigen ligase